MHVWAVQGLVLAVVGGVAHLPGLKVVGRIQKQELRSRGVAAQAAKEDVKMSLPTPHLLVGVLGI